MNVFPTSAASSSKHSAPAGSHTCWTRHLLPAHRFPHSSSSAITRPYQNCCKFLTLLPHTKSLKTRFGPFLRLKTQRTPAWNPKNYNRWLRLLFPQSGPAAEHQPGLPAAPQPCQGRRTCPCGPGRDGGGTAAGAEGEEGPEPAALAAESSFLPGCRLGGARGRQRHGIARPPLSEAGSGRPPPLLPRALPPAAAAATDRRRVAPPLPPPRTSRRRGGLRSSGGEKGGVTCRAGSRGLGSSWSQSCRSGGRERRRGARPGAAPPPWRSRRSSTGSTRPAAGPPSTRWGAAARPGAAPQPRRWWGERPFPRSLSAAAWFCPPHTRPQPRGVCPSCRGPCGGSAALRLPSPSVGAFPSPSAARRGLARRSALPSFPFLPAPRGRAGPPLRRPLPVERRWSPAHLLLLLLPRGARVGAGSRQPPPAAAVPRGGRSAGRWGGGLPWAPGPPPVCPGRARGEPAGAPSAGAPSHALVPAPGSAGGWAWTCTPRHPLTLPPSQPRGSESKYRIWGFFCFIVFFTENRWWAAWHAPSFSVTLIIEESLKTAC